MLAPILLAATAATMPAFRRVVLQWSAVDISTARRTNGRCTMSSFAQRVRRGSPESKVIRGVAGYRCSRHVHESWRGFSYGLPVVVETIDREENIDAFAPTVQQLRQGATVIRQRLQVLQP